MPCKKEDKGAHDLTFWKAKNNPDQILNKIPLAFRMEDFVNAFNEATKTTQPESLEIHEDFNRKYGKRYLLFNRFIKIQTQDLLQS